MAIRCDSLCSIVKEGLCVYEAMRSLGFPEHTISLEFVGAPKGEIVAAMVVKDDEIGTEYGVPLGRPTELFTREDILDDWEKAMEARRTDSLKGFDKILKKSRLVDTKLWQDSLRRNGMAIVGSELMN